MKLLRFLVIATIVLMAARTARADDPQVVFDPVIVSGFNGYIITPGEIGQLLTGLSWGSCALTQQIGGDTAAAFANSTACMYFANESGAPITSLTFSFAVTSDITGWTGCSSADGILTFNDCPTAGTIPGGSTVDATFSGGNPIPYTAGTQVTLFIIGEQGVDPANFTPTLQIPTYDPSTLILLASGIGLLGLCGLRRTA
jgi:hypothetical protein